MKLEEAKERCNELIKEKHANWIGLTSQEAISTVLQEIEHLQKKKAEYEARWNNTAHELRIFKNECVPKSEIRNLISKLDVDIERNKKREIMYEEEKGTSEYVCRLIAYTPETVKGILINLLKEE